MRIYLAICGALALAGCVTTEQKSGVGFGSYETYAQQQAGLAQERNAPAEPQFATATGAPLAGIPATPEPVSTRVAAAPQRQARQVVEPKPVPARVATGPNVVEYSLSTTNAVGESLYRRSGLTGQSALARKCFAYRSEDAAQEAFLKAGGPKTDRLGIDPDGDGFACDFNPAIYRAAVR